MATYKITPEQRAKYKETERLKRLNETPEEREARLARRREYEMRKRKEGGEERRQHDREVRIAYVNRKRLDNPDWESDRYKKSKCVKAQRAAELAKTLKEGEQICSRCKFVRRIEDFPVTRTGKRSTMCKKCYDQVTKEFDTESLSYWKTQAARINTKAKHRLVKLGADLDTRFHPVTGEQLMELWETQKHQCAYCHTDLTVLITAYDHKHPLSKGGEHSIDNLQLICHNCNVSKFTMDDEDYRKLIQ